MFELTSIGTFAIPPDSRGAAAVFSHLGYDLKTALADLIDNSVDAGSSNVDVTFLPTDNRVAAVTVADDGCGMDEETLHEAMRFAAAGPKPPGKLGAFGIGLKSASLSQCKTFSVITKNEGIIAACRWTVEGIKDGWRCEILDPKVADNWFAAGYSTTGVPKTNGTVVVWERLSRLHPSHDLDQFLSDQLNRLEYDLGLIFHRFITKKTINIHLLVREPDESTGLPRTVEPYDPFGYRATGRTGYPRTFRASLPSGGEMELKAHIWPAGSNQPAFRLGRKTGTSFQGIYFYRNDRLVQAGGWNGLVKDTADVELSLARMSVELIDIGVHEVTVQKSGIQVSHSLYSSLASATSGKKSIQDYLEDARRAFRAGRRHRNPGAHAPVIPNLGYQLRQRALSNTCWLPKTRPSAPWRLNGTRCRAARSLT